MEKVLEIIAIILSVFTGGGAGTMAMWLNKKNKNIKEQNVSLQNENENIKSELKIINKEIANIQNINNIYIKEFNELKSEIQLSILRIETKLDIMTVNFNNKLSNNNEINIKHKQGDKKMKNKKMKIFFLRILYWTIHGLTLGLPALLAQFNKLLIKLKDKIKKECDQLCDEKIEIIIKNDNDKIEE